MPKTIKITDEHFQKLGEIASRLGADHATAFHHIVSEAHEQLGTKPNSEDRLPDDTKRRLDEIGTVPEHGEPDVDRPRDAPHAKGKPNPLRVWAGRHDPQSAKKK